MFDRAGRCGRYVLRLLLNGAAFQAACAITAGYWWLFTSSLRGDRPWHFLASIPLSVVVVASWEFWRRLRPA